MTRYFFTCAATFSTVTTGIMSPFSHLFTFSDDSSYFLQRSCFLDQWSLPLPHLQTHSPPSWTETDTSRLRFPGKASDVLRGEVTSVGDHARVPHTERCLSFPTTTWHCGPLCCAPDHLWPWDGFPQCWVFPTLSLGSWFFLFIEITIRDIHHCSPEHKACFAAVKGY